MKRLLITGANGFVGTYACDAFAAAGYTVIRAGFAAASLDVSLNLSDAESVRNAVRAARPDAVLHLAAQSFVPQAISDPLSTYDVNVMGTARLLAALRSEERPIRFLFTSSAEVYGRQALRSVPLCEDHPVLPANPYAASKAAAENLVRAEYGGALTTVIARPFNHIGPGQDPRFVVAGFAQQLAGILAGGEPRLAVGNLEAERDFLDVRDVVQAYIALLESGAPGETYNIASGRAVSIREILRRLIFLADTPVRIEEDPARMRPSEIPQSYGDASKIREATGWAPSVRLDDSLAAILDAARACTPAG